MILVISSKKVYAAKRLLQEAGIRNKKLEITGVEDLAAGNFKVDIGRFSILYVRDPYFKTSPKYIPDVIKLAKKFKEAGKKVVDSNIADGEIGKGKRADCQRLQQAGLSVPKTSLLHGYKLNAKCYPLILKWTYGFKGRDVFLIQNLQQLKKVLSLHPENEWLLQEFIKAGYEYKVITVGYKALPVMLRFKIKDLGFRANFSSHGVILNPNASEGEESKHKEILRPRALPQDDAMKEIFNLAESASRLLGRELAKIDILESQGKFYILEVNRFPGLKSFEMLTGYNVVGDFIEYLASGN